MDHAMDITTTTTSTSAPLSSPLTTKKLEATTFALNDMEIDDSNFDGMLDAFFDPEESFADLPDDAVDEALLCELETFDDCGSEAFSSVTAFPEEPLHAPRRSSAATSASVQSFHSCADSLQTPKQYCMLHAELVSKSILAAFSCWRRCMFLSSSASACSILRTLLSCATSFRTAKQYCMLSVLLLSASFFADFSYCAAFRCADQP